MQIHGTYLNTRAPLYFILFYLLGLVIVNLPVAVLMHCSRIATFFICQALFAYLHITLKKSYRIASLECFHFNFSFVTEERV